eukprot:s1603_g6.t1
MLVATLWTSPTKRNLLFMENMILQMFQLKDLTFSMFWTKGQMDEIMGREIPERQEIAPALREDAAAEVIVINDVRVTPTRSVDTLRAAGRFFGVSTAGSKRKIYDRIRAAHVHSLRLRALEVARGEYEAMRLIFNFKMHRHSQRCVRESCTRSFHTLQCDFYTGMGNLNVLIMVDSWTKCIGVEPLRNKLQSVVGGAVARFLGELGYYGQVELAFDSEPVGPWKLKRGVNTELKPMQTSQKPLPLLHVPVGGVEPEFVDDDERAVMKYAREHPQEDVDDKNEEQKASEESQAKFVKFDPDAEVLEPSPKQPRTAFYSPVYAGEISGSPATSSTSRHVRRVVEEVELYDEDELESGAAEDVWEGALWEDQQEIACEKVEIPEAEQRRRGFFDEGAGPPDVSEDELAWLDQEAMHAELDRLRHLDVIADVDDVLDVEGCVKLDTRLVRDWRLRDG